ncbi:hypothetical protein GCK32_002651 [Trichostrongylus colubriformis]|uniref:Uncharacterized protein n=1 Tax=Trichostrongylus colubriformis TaxID=6319 RepID=A0AAN8IQ36_TRICO
MNITYVPFIDQWFKGLPAVYIVFIGICSCVFVGITVLTVLMAVKVHFHVPNEYVQGDLYFIIFVPFIVSGMCLIGNIIPRAAPVTYAVGLIFLMLCLNTTIIIIIRLFGTRNGMAKWLMENEKMLYFDVRPYCCCCHCLPSMTPNPTKVRRLTYFVRQSPLVRVFLQVVIVILGIEGISDGSAVLQVLNGLGVASTLIAVFVCHVIVTATRDVLTPYSMYVIFRCVDTTQMLYTFQKFILDLIAKNGGMGGFPVASPSMVARFWHNVAMTFEVGIVCVVMFRNIRPGKSAFFAEPSESVHVCHPMPLANL